MVKKLLEDRVMGTINEFLDKIPWPEFIPWITASPLGLSGIVAVVTVLILLVLAYVETRDKVANAVAYSSEKRLWQPINLEIDLTRQSLALMRPSLQQPIEANGWLLYLHGVRITNRSATNSLSLDLKLTVALNDNESSRTELQILLSSTGSRMWTGADNYLHAPIKIPAQESVEGDLGFWVDPFTEVALGGDLSTALKRRGSMYGELDASLEIQDHISGRVAVVEIPGVHSVEQAD